MTRARMRHKQTEKRICPCSKQTEFGVIPVHRDTELFAYGGCGPVGEQSWRELNPRLARVFALIHSPSIHMGSIPA
ncbi:unnamed protein product [Boreogadus saida]